MSLVLANVENVTLTHRQLLVPLIPVGSNMALLKDSVQRNYDLLERGYPFSQVKAWLKEFLQPQEFHRLAAKYA